MPEFSCTDLLPVGADTTDYRGVFDAYTKLNLRYSQLAPLTMWEERTTGSNLPAQIRLAAGQPMPGYLRPDREPAR